MSTAFLLCLLVLFLLAAIGMPIAYAILVGSFVYLFAAGQNIGLAGKTMMDGLYQSFILLAVPLFIVAANIMNAGTISDRLLNFCVAARGPVPGRARPCQRRGVADLLGHVGLGRRGRGRGRQDHHRDDDQDRPLHPRLRRRDHRGLGHHRADHPAVDPDGALRARLEHLDRLPLSRRHRAGPPDGRGPHGPERLDRPPPRLRPRGGGAARATAERHRRGPSPRC
jgi:hypothetical protein